MKRSILRKVFLSTIGLLVTTLLVQMFIQIFLLDDIYRFMKTREMEKQFDDFINEFEVASIDEDSMHYLLDNDAPIIVLNQKKEIINTSFFESMSYIELQSGQKSYKILLGDRVDERGVLDPSYIHFSKGQDLKLIGGLIKGTNVISLDTNLNNPIMDQVIEVQGQVTKEHFVRREAGVYSYQQEKLLRELAMILQEDMAFEGMIDFHEGETGLTILLQKQYVAGYQVVSLYTLDDLSRVFVILNKYLIYLFVFQVVMLVGLTFVYSKWITRPLKALHADARRIANLDFSQESQVKTKDELEDLSHSLNSISKNLSEKIDILKSDAKEKAEKESKMRELLANLSHEFKTPLGIMSGFLEMLAVNEADKDYYIQTINEEIDKLNHLTKETLLLCESENLESSLKLKRHSVKSFIQTDKFLSDANKSDMTLHVSVEDMYVLCDLNKMIMVMDNFISNALKYSNEGAQIFVSAEKKDQVVLIQVKNTGVTLTDEELKMIWHKYYRTEKSRNKAYGGNGLGLAIVKNLLDHHEFLYGVYNDDQAVVFYLEIPLA